MSTENTTKYYDENAKILTKKYNQANMKALHQLFYKYIKKDDVVLDIGFGSGRDMREISNITSNLYGLDSCTAFIESMKETPFENKVGYTLLPKIDTSCLPLDKEEFDVIVSIAVLMHLKKDDISLSIQNMKKILKDEATLIISYSTERKIKDKRHFEPITEDMMTSLFNQHGFEVIDSFENSDVMNRDVKWITQVYKPEQKNKF